MNRPTKWGLWLAIALNILAAGVYLESSFGRAQFYCPDRVQCPPPIQLMTPHVPVDSVSGDGLNV